LTKIIELVQLFRFSCSQIYRFELYFLILKYIDLIYIVTLFGKRLLLYLYKKYLLKLVVGLGSESMVPEPIVLVNSQALSQAY